MKHPVENNPQPSEARTLSDTLSVTLALLCTAAYIVLCFLFAKDAESVGALLVIMLLWFPALPVITVTELIHRFTASAPRRRTIELVGLLLSAAGSLLMSGFWLLMILQGGNKMIPMGMTVIAVNAAAILLLWSKRKIVHKRGET